MLSIRLLYIRLSTATQHTSIMAIRSAAAVAIATAIVARWSCTPAEMLPLTMLLLKK